MEPRVLIVIPTLGNRIEFLRAAFDSIRAQGPGIDITLVTPAERIGARAVAAEYGARVLDDPGSLPGAVKMAVAAAEPHHEFVNWLGDDDLLAPGAVQACVDALDADPSAVLSFGDCAYIDDQGRHLWTNRTGRFAPWLLSWGPDLVPQPGALIRTTAWQCARGVDETLSHAFDLDLLLKLKRQGSFVHVGRVVSSFRWHADSLTVADRSKSLAESEAVKRRYLGPVARRVAWTWELPVRVATKVAAREVGRRAQRVLQAN